MQHAAGFGGEYLPQICVGVVLQIRGPLCSARAEIGEGQGAAGESGNSTAPDHIRGALSPWRAAEAGSWC